MSGYNIVGRWLQSSKRLVGLWLRIGAISIEQDVKLALVPRGLLKTVKRNVQLVQIVNDLILVKVFVEPVDGACAFKILRIAEQ